jgi:hypothetical protein
MTTESSIKKEILKLEAIKEALLNEDDILWDEVNTAERDLVYLRRALEISQKDKG